MKKQYLKGYVEKTQEDGIISVAVATDLTQDRDGEIVNPQGMELDNFMKNPVLLWAHDYRGEPIGKVLDIRVENNRVLFRPQFNLAFEKGKQIFEMFQKGFLNAFSIGFIPKEREGNIFTKSELLEISAVPVPSNPNALVMIRGAMTDADVMKDIEQAQKDELIESMNSEIKLLRDGLKKLENSILENEKNGAEHKGSEKRSKQFSEVALAKRLLQTLDKHIGLALREFKESSK